MDDRARRIRILVESISDIRLATLEALWIEETIPFPNPTAEITWEIWLRRQNDVDHLARLHAFAQNFNLTVRDQTITFVDRTVVLVRGTAHNLSRSVDILGMIAELRLPKETAAFFSEMAPKEQREWVEDLGRRIARPVDGAPYICLFDTGLNAAHPLLAAVADQADLHTYKPAWGVDDRQGHGTPMAGLATFGDLTDVLGGSGTCPAPIDFESVKIIHEPDPHEPELYGAVTQESVSRVEIEVGRRRVFCMAVSAADARDRGRPSSWSAAVDALASGAEDGQRRLMILSAGNTDPRQRRHLPGFQYDGRDS